MDDAALQHDQGKRGLELIEEAVHLLRQAPPGVLVTYYAGTVPFFLGFLYFWADMSRGYNATRHLLPASVALAALFLLMKCCHSVFGARLKALMGQGDAPRLTAGRLWRLAALQGIYQPWGLVVLPLALLVTVPFGWCFAFFQSLSVQGLDFGINSREARQEALRLALLWPAQNHIALGTLLAFGLLVWVNLFVAGIMVPHLVKTLLGIESVFTRSGFHLLNTTFLMIVTAATYMCVDPLVKAFYTIRNFYGQARESGEDLLIELGRTAARKRSALPAVLLALGLAAGACFPALSAAAADPAPGSGEPAARSATPGEVEKAVDTVLKRLEYTWRTPRGEDEMEEERRGFWYELIVGTLDLMKRVFAFLGDVVEWVADLIRKLLPNRDLEPGEVRSGDGGVGHVVLYVLLFAGVAACVVVLEKMVRRRRTGGEEEVVGGPDTAAVDLADESVMASDLPELEWLKLAADLLERGEGRLAVRALYLASLAHLADQGLITLARHKTDREYERELAARGPVATETSHDFSLTTAIFERTWYGMHETTGPVLETFRERHGRVMAHGT